MNILGILKFKLNLVIFGLCCQRNNSKAKQRACQHWSQFRYSVTNNYHVKVYLSCQDYDACFVISSNIGYGNGNILWQSRIVVLNQCIVMWRPKTNVLSCSKSRHIQVPLLMSLTFKHAFQLIFNYWLAKTIWTQSTKHE